MEKGAGGEGPGKEEEEHEDDEDDEDDGPRFGSAAPGIWHLACGTCVWHLERAFGICIALHLVLHLAFGLWHLACVIWRRGARCEEAGDDQEGRNATLCAAMLRHAMQCCAMRSAMLILRRAAAMPKRRTRKG